MIHADYYLITQKILSVWSDSMQSKPNFPCTLQDVPTAIHLQQQVVVWCDPIGSLIISAGSAISPNLSILTSNDIIYSSRLMLLLIFFYTYKPSTRLGRLNPTLYQEDYKRKSTNNFEFINVLNYLFKHAYIGASYHLPDTMLCFGLPLKNEKQSLLFLTSWLSNWYLTIKIMVRIGTSEFFKRISL